MAEEARRPPRPCSVVVCSRLASTSRPSPLNQNTLLFMRREDGLDEYECHKIAFAALDVIEERGVFVFSFASSPSRTPPFLVDACALLNPNGGCDTD